MPYTPGSFNYTSPYGSGGFSASMPSWFNDPTPMMEQLLAARTRARLAEQQPMLSETGRQFDVSSGEGRREFDLQHALASSAQRLQAEEAERAFNAAEAQRTFENNWRRMHGVGASGWANQVANRFNPSNRLPIPKWNAVTGGLNSPEENWYYSRYPAQTAAATTERPTGRRQYVSPYANYGMS